MTTQATTAHDSGINDLFEKIEAGLNQSGKSNPRMQAAELQSAV